LEAKGRLVHHAEGHVMALFHVEGAVYALDNRCPHMGFPLDRGALESGILTCPWHHARFELCSGGAFDLFADDARTFPTRVQGGEVWVDVGARRDELSYQKGRLRDGLEQNLPLVLAKASIGLLDRNEDPAEVLRIGGLFGATQRDAGWRDGLTILSAMGNLLPQLSEEDRPLALFHGLRHIAKNVAGARPHFALEPLPTRPTAERLETWLRRFVEVRDRDGAERTLLTALHAGYGDRVVADLLGAAVTDHYYLDGGHSLDFVNKAFELLDLIGWEHAAPVLPSVLPGLTGGARMEETAAWRSPVDLVGILEPIFTELLSGELTTGVRGGTRLSDAAFTGLADILLGDEPAASAHALAEALRRGAALTELSGALRYAAALRVARFSTSNEFSDWVSVLHTFTAANATHKLLTRAPSLELARGIWHAAMHLYLNRFLNVPAARLPDERSTGGLSEDPDALLETLLELTDARQRVEEAAAVTYRYLRLGHPPPALVRTLAHTLLREDGEFHSYQMLEAGVSLYNDLRATRSALAPVALVAVARYLAGHAPTDRSSTQTYRIARRLHAGEALSAGA